MKCFLLIFFILIINNEIFLKAEYFSSIYKMSFLLDNELKILKKFENFIKRNENKLEFLKE